MADLIPPMMIKLQADVNDLKVGLAKAESAMKGVDDSVKKASTGMTNFMSKIKQVGATMGVAFAGQQIVQFGKDIVMAASDMNETMSKTNVIFGEGFDISIDEQCAVNDLDVGHFKTPVYGDVHHHAATIRLTNGHVNPCRSVNIYNYFLPCG